MVDDEQVDVVFDKEFKKKDKQRKSGNFQSRSFTFFGVGIFLLFLFVAILAPNLTGPDNLIPYEPLVINLNAQYLPPFSYEPEAITGIFPIENRITAPNERTIAGIIHTESVEFTNGLGTTNYKQISQIDSIDDSGTERWTDVTNPGFFDGTTGEIQLTDTTINRAMNVSYRIGGKFAFQIQAGSEKILQISVKLKIAAASQSSFWQGSMRMHIYDIDGLKDDGVLSDAEPLGVSNEIEGKTIITGGTTLPRLYSFTFRSFELILNQNYWVVLDADIANVNDQKITQTLVIAVDNPGRPLEDLYQKGWNAESGWNVGISVLSDEGFIPYFVIYKPTNLFHILGTDALGRDVLASVIWGIQTTFIIAFLAVCVEILIGLSMGFFVQAIFKEKTFQSIPNMSYGFPLPFFFLIIIMMVVWEQTNIITFAITIGCFSWTRLSRIGGKPTFQTMVVVVGNIGDIILISSFLAFIGFGPPMNVSLGTTIQWGMQGHTLGFAPHVAIIPGIIITLMIFSFNLIKQGLLGDRINQLNFGSESLNENEEWSNNSKNLKSDSGNVSGNYGSFLNIEFLFQFMTLPIFMAVLILMDILPSLLSILIIIIPFFELMKLIAVATLIGLPMYVYQKQDEYFSQYYFALSSFVFLGGALLLLSVTLA